VYIYKLAQKTFKLMLLTVCGSPEIHCRQVLFQDHYRSFSPSHQLVKHTSQLIHSGQ